MNNIFCFATALMILIKFFVFLYVFWILIHYKNIEKFSLIFQTIITIDIIIMVYWFIRGING